MRRIIIDTDTGSDDAVALIMALKSPEIKIEAITTLSGNCELDQATKNALMTIEITNTVFPPVYKGSDVPLFKELGAKASVEQRKKAAEELIRIHPIQNITPVMLETVPDQPRHFVGLRVNFRHSFDAHKPHSIAIAQSRCVDQGHHDLLYALR